MTLRPEGSQGTKFVIAVGNECLFEAAQPLHTYHISALAVLKRVSDYSKFSLYLVNKVTLGPRRFGYPDKSGRRAACIGMLNRAWRAVIIRGIKIVVLYRVVNR